MYVDSREVKKGEIADTEIREKQRDKPTHSLPSFNVWNLLGSHKKQINHIRYGAHYSEKSIEFQLIWEILTDL